MTGQEIIDLQGYFLKGMHNYAGDAPTSAQALAQLNWAIRCISRRIFQYDSSILFTPVADTTNYLLSNSACFSRKVIRPYSVVINEQPLLAANGSDYGMWSLQELERSIPGWRNADSGTPTIACYYGNNRLVLYMPPTAAVVSAGHSYVSGQYLAEDLTTITGTAGTPDIPEHLHEALAYYAAVKAAMPEAGDEVAWMRINAYNTEWQALIAETERENRQAIQDWGTTQGYHQPDWMAM